MRLIWPDMAQQPDYDVNWWLANCELTGGSSGGPWIQPLVNGSGDIVSVNSWGYTGYPGMAGPKLDAYTASCLFSAAKGTGFDELPSAVDGDAGVIVPAECAMK